MKQVLLTLERSAKGFGCYPVTIPFTLMFRVVPHLELCSAKAKKSQRCVVKWVGVLPRKVMKLFDTVISLDMANRPLSLPSLGCFIIDLARSNIPEAVC